MVVTLHEKQLEVANDRHRFRVICAGRRWGKSVLAQLIVLQWATQQAGTYWIVNPTYRQGKSIHWRGLQQIIPREWILKKNEVELSITLRNGSVIELKGAENPDALRGVKLRGLVIDEIASIRNWDWLWSEVLRQTLTDYEAPALFISTPKGYNHFHQLFQQGQGLDNKGGVYQDLGQANGVSDYKSWRFTSYDNPYIPTSEIDKAKEELTEDTFYQEYMADFRKFTGLVYKDFDRQVHVIEPFDIPDSWSIYRGLDFGSTNPTACLWVAVGPDENWYIAREHYATGQTIDFHAGIINADPLSSPGRCVATYGDPSGAQWISEFAERGIYITPANKEVGQAFNTWVTFGIDKVSQKLKVTPGHSVPTINSTSPMGMPSLFIFSTCINTIREFETYRWKEKAVTQAQDLNQPDVVEKANDHALDALRYFAVSYKKREPVVLPPPWQPSDNVIGI